MNCDVVVLGSGPAGTSAALALVQRGISVILVAGRQYSPGPQAEGTYRHVRLTDPEAHRWMLGEGQTALQGRNAVSPKFRVPALLPVFDGFTDRSLAAVHGFFAVGSLVAGGLSNAWGCGVAEFRGEDLVGYPKAARDLHDSYARVCKRIGVSGDAGDQLDSEYGLTGFLEPPPPLHPVAAKLLAQTKRPNDQSFLLGRSRIAAISSERRGRNGCRASGRCLWGCPNQAIYSSRMELPALEQHPACRVIYGLADAIRRSNQGWAVSVASDAGDTIVNCDRLIVAAGVLESTRLVLSTLEVPARRVKLSSTPMAAYVVWLPRAVGIPAATGSALPQLSFMLKSDHHQKLYGNLFPTTGLPIYEFASKAPLAVDASYELFPPLLASSLVGNIFLPSEFSDHWLSLSKNGKLEIEGGLQPEAASVFSSARSCLRRNLLKRGALLLPGSFAVGLPGADVHYAGTLPMSDNPKFLQSSSLGEVAGLPKLHVVDGAILPSIPGKPHTLTIMANADRIGASIATLIAAGRAA